MSKSTTTSSSKSSSKVKDTKCAKDAKESCVGLNIGDGNNIELQIT